MSDAEGRGLVGEGEGGGRLIRKPPVGSNPTEWWPQEDEIDLVDLGVSLWRQKRLILGVFMLVFLLGIVAALLHGRTYDYSAVVEIGSYTTPKGDVVPIEDAASALATMKDAYLPNAIQEYVRDHKKVSPRQIKIKATSPKDSDVIHLVAKGPASLGPVLLAVEQHAAQSLVSYDSRTTNVIRARLNQALGNAQLKLQRLQDPSLFQVNELAKERALANAKASVSRLRGEAKVLKTRLKNEQSLRKILSERAKSLLKYMSSARKQMQAGGKVTHSVQNAMSMLLLGTEMQRNANRLQQVEQKLTANIPNALANIRQKMARNARQQAIAQKRVSQAKENLKQFKAQHKRSIKAQKLKISELQTQIKNVSNTSLASKPNRSNLPVGLSRTAIVLLSVVLGVVLSLLIALVSAYVSAVRSRLHGDDGLDFAPESG